MFDRKVFLHLDWWLLGYMAIIMIIGVINLNSASTAGSYYQWKQAQWYAAGTVFMLLCIIFDYRVLASHAVHIYILTVVLLLLVIFVGKSVSGSQRWIPLGFFNLQPSEFAKLSTVIVVSSYFYHNEKPSYGIKDLIRPTLLMAVPFFLIFRQPDLGTALLVLLIMASIILVAGLRWTSILTIATACIAAAPLAWKLMKPYQRERIKIFLNPESDPLGSGYHIIQSKIAIGSGQLFGKGYMAGTQAHLDFLPEVHTDFAFSIWAEEWGFIGAFILLSVYFLIIAKGLQIASQSKERFGSFLAFGITAMLFWQAVINICMVTGLMPVVGIPLPMISYGGSSVITTMIGVGLLINIKSRRFIFDSK
ncbi:MAG: rod shape-determining protein RodA [Dissulfurimicrobium hydrothermale]|uniref:rod shape-determining protein RodA n=1 Tax=Dissulfurimicrobium hydrothermale TaxID=1750598 RepID=UPI003C731120